MFRLIRRRNSTVRDQVTVMESHKDSVTDSFPNLLFLSETNFLFCRVNIDIHKTGIKGKGKECNGEAAPGKEGTVTLPDCGNDGG